MKVVEARKLLKDLYISLLLDVSEEEAINISQYVKSLTKNELLSELNKLNLAKKGK